MTTQPTGPGAIAEFAFASAECERLRKQNAEMMAALKICRAMDLSERDRAWNELSRARDALESELGALNITIESATPPPRTSSPGCAAVAEERK